MAAARAGLILVLLLAATLAALPLRLGEACGLPAHRLLRLCCTAVLGLLGVRLDVRGAPTAGARLLVANHVSWIDILVLASLEPLCFLAKREVAAWPLIGTLARLNRTVFIDRARRRTIPAVNRTMAARLALGHSVLLFPEGTTHGVLPGLFKSSHLACLRDRLTEHGSGTACAQPVALHYSDPAAAWLGEATLLPHLWTILKGPPLVCVVSYGEALAVTPGFDRKALGRAMAERIGEVVARLAAQSGSGVSSPRPPAADAALSAARRGAAAGRSAW